MKWNRFIEGLKFDLSSVGVDGGKYAEYVKKASATIKQGASTLKQASFRVFG